ncbi:MAG: type II toxin-antitoxin system HigB family toxin [Myxococcota bacterium]
MRLIKETTLRGCWNKHPEAKSALQNWRGSVKAASWNGFNDVIKTFPDAERVRGSDRVRFKIANNDYRLICAINFRLKAVYVKWFGSHNDYDKIKPETATNFEKFEGNPKAKVDP